ncbi:MAG: PP2C family protein-serine/threonine phosphatase [Candidatus Rifleibacteriota bacterium]
MKPKILLVDDEPNIIASYSRGLRKNWDLATAMSGDEGLKIIAENGPFNIIVSDFNMPRMDGVAFLARTLEIAPESIRMILTGEGDFQIATKAVNEGNIFRFLTKPCSLDQLEMALKAAWRQYQLTQVEKEARQQELMIAGEIQKNLLFEIAPMSMKFFEAAAMSVPSKSVDGDFIDFFQISSTRLDVAVGDVMGKGLHAAMVGAGARNTLNRVLWQLGLNDKERVRPQSIVRKFADAIIPGLEQVQKFLTLVYASFDYEKKSMSWVDAGHTPILWYSNSTLKWSDLKGENSPVGLPSMRDFVEKSIEFAAGDLFLFYSDGLLDGRNKTGEFYGDRAMIDCLNSSLHLSPEFLVKALVEDNARFVGKADLIDDLTVVAIKIL